MALHGGYTSFPAGEQAGPHLLPAKQMCYNKIYAVHAARKLGSFTVGENYVHRRDIRKKCGETVRQGPPACPPAAENRWEAQDLRYKLLPDKRLIPADRYLAG